MGRNWLTTIQAGDEVRRIAEALTKADGIEAAGAWGSCAHLLAGAIQSQTGRPLLLIVAHLDDADEAAEDLALYEGLNVAQFNALEMMPGETNVSLEQLTQRLGLANTLEQDDQPDVIVAPIQALMQAVPTGEAMADLIRPLETGRTMDPGDLVRWLEDVGYQRVDAIDIVGDYTVRGGIVDIYTPGETGPVRIDFFGDQIDHIAEIDLDSMGSDRKLDSVRLVGAAAESLLELADATGLWERMDKKTIVVFAEMLEISEQARGYYQRLTDDRGIYPPAAVFKAMNRFARVEINQIAQSAGTDRKVDLPVSPLPGFADQATQAVSELGELAEGKSQQVAVLCANDAERDRLEQLLADQLDAGSAEAIRAELGYLHRGFTWGKWALVPNHELFHRYTVRRRVRSVRGGISTQTFFDLDEGDYVVHEDHGIARFQGLRTMTQGNGPGEEYLTLQFDGRALLHVPASQIEKVQKYVGGFAGRPPLSKLGGGRWSKQKQQVAEAVRDMAAELLRVQAARDNSPGIRYPADTEWMRRFEAEFPYTETEDQLAAMTEIKKDMSDDRSMDRLLCGDVGYGKTELAIRAAFKAIEHGKQVAVLCPTTVLCEQHERTFRQRMADYPVRVESLSRFKCGAEAGRIVRELAEGRVDLVIGTHRLLSDDVTFKDLGLIVVDEEQRFGVEHKNKLMRFRVTVDVLTMSATPIPRTLHQALLGLRSISSLATPPADRRAVVTEVLAYDSHRIRQAILRELNRDGQCFFVHNRVYNIRSIADEVHRLVPEARVEYAHGQMRPRELEAVMMRFLDRRVDVLVCTTIIESGIDIPTANTMFINDADRFGLAELHQLRGRVGRYKHRAYCYLMLPQQRPVSDVAARRLRAIEECSMLGAGFKIAMRDMEIRGVGNLLGPEQSGHIASVGYQMYCRLLEQTTRELQQEKTARPVRTHMELNLAGHLPRLWLPNSARRMAAYRRIATADTPAELDCIAEDLREAYGDLPAPTELLLELAAIRVGLGTVGVESLKLKDRDLIYTTPRLTTLYDRLNGAPGSVRLVDPPDDGKPATVYHRPPADLTETPDELLEMLKEHFVKPLGK